MADPMIDKEKYDALYENWLERGAKIVELQNEICVLSGGQRLPRECPHGGEHNWKSHCPKCDMRIFYNPEATIVKQGSDEEAQTTQDI